MKFPKIITVRLGATEIDFERPRDVRGPRLTAHTHGFDFTIREASFGDGLFELEGTFHGKEAEHHAFHFTEVCAHASLEPIAIERALGDVLGRISARMHDALSNAKVELERAQTEVARLEGANAKLTSNILACLAGKVSS